MKLLEDIKSYKKVLMKSGMIAAIYCISNGIGNKLYGEKFSRKDICNWTFKFGNSKICIWTISHFIMHFIIAYEYNIDKMQQMFIGFYWEFIEEYIIDIIPGMKTNCNSGTYKGNYWRAEVKDIYMNVLGMLTGQKLRSMNITSEKKNMLDFLTLATLMYNIALHIKLYKDR